MKRPPKSKRAALLKWVKQAEPDTFGRSCALKRCPDAVEASKAICAMRHRGDATPSQRVVADKLREMYPELGPGFSQVQLRDYVQRYVKGGWGGKV